MTNIDNLVETAEKLLANLKVKYTRNYLQSEICSHPYYPSLVSISDVLDIFHVNNYAIKTEYPELLKIKSPFVVHLKIAQGFFAFVENITESHIEVYYEGEKTKYSKESFFNIWDGIIFVADRNKESCEPDYIQHKNEKRIESLTFAVFVGLLVGCFGFSLVLNNSIVTLVPIFVVQGLGLFFTWLLTKHEFGQTNKIADKLCTATKSAGCNEVLKSKGSKLLGKISLADIGVIWMTSSTLYLFFAAIINNNVFPYVNIFGWCLFFSIPFICFSIGYQLFVVRKYCPLCLGVMSTLLINICLMWFYYDFSFEIPDFKSIIGLSLIMIISSFVWINVKKLIQKSIDLVNTRSKYLSLKRNPAVISVLQSEQQTVDISSIHQPVRITNSNSGVVVTEVINLYCPPCKNAFEKIDNYLSKFPDNNLDVQFILTTYDGDESMNTTAKHLIALAQQEDLQQVRAAMKSWYETMNYAEWSKTFPVNIEDAHKSQLQKHKDWCDNNEIIGTPTIFLNDRVMSGNLDFVDLRYMDN